MSHSDHEKKKTTVEIYNRSYTVVGDEDPHHVRVVASLVDQTMRDINEANPRLDTAKLAVLTAVNTMSDYLKLKEECADLMKHIEKLEKEDNQGHD
ncbi:cell division protein ZapA [Salimicrobium flavidum]|uniref:Cell division protein ZapA n=1 Tax=Salimicrobium flavidum TaxID=570947 RepID=A0A1N7JPK0_9BACI|nr:cell division protein ZapA [Salimicrobium flavidum]